VNTCKEASNPWNRRFAVSCERSFNGDLTRAVHQRKLPGRAAGYERGYRRERMSEIFERPQSEADEADVALDIE
jgi:hypothetical protein